MIENFGESLGNDPKTIPSWGILTNLSSHSISMMRELIGFPISVGYASRSGGIGSRSDGGGKEGEGMGWWNVIFDYEGFKAHYEVCLLLFRAYRYSHSSSHLLLLRKDEPSLCSPSGRGVWECLNSRADKA